MRFGQSPRFQKQAGSPPNTVFYLYGGMHVALPWSLFTPSWPILEWWDVVKVEVNAEYRAKTRERRASGRICCNWPYGGFAFMCRYLCSYWSASDVYCRLDLSRNEGERVMCHSSFARTTSGSPRCWTQFAAFGLVSIRRGVLLFVCLFTRVMSSLPSWVDHLILAMVPALRHHCRCAYPLAATIKTLVARYV